jgi:ankyrin repeat protein
MDVADAEMNAEARRLEEEKARADAAAAADAEAEFRALQKRREAAIEAAHAEREARARALEDARRKKLKPGSDAASLPYVDGTDPLYRAANNGDIAAVKRVLKAMNKRQRWVAANSRNEDADDRSALHVAASRGYLLMTRELLDAGAELLPDEKGRTPLHLAAANDDEPLVKLLLKRAKRRWDAKTAFTTGGYARPAAPVHLCKTPTLRKLLAFRGCGDDDGGQTRIKVEGDGRGVEITTSMKIAAGLAAFVVALYVRARRQIEEGYARPTKYVR